MYCQDMKFSFGTIKHVLYMEVFLLCPLYLVSIKRGFTVLSLTNEQLNFIGQLTLHLKQIAAMNLLKKRPLIHVIRM